jgi:hypothetical protein
MFQATMCPSSGADYCVMLSSCVGICRGCRKAVKTLPANWSWQPSCSHGTYQHEAITSHSRQLLMMGTWLSETCWATNRREIKNTKVKSSWFFLSTVNYNSRSTAHLMYYISIFLLPWNFHIKFCVVFNKYTYPL